MVAGVSADSLLLVTMGLPQNKSWLSRQDLDPRNTNNASTHGELGGTRVRKQPSATPAGRILPPNRHATCIFPDREVVSSEVIGFTNTRRSIRSAAMTTTAVRNRESGHKSVWKRRLSRWRSWCASTSHDASEWHSLVRRIPQRCFVTGIEGPSHGKQGECKLRPLAGFAAIWLRVGQLDRRRAPFRRQCGGNYVFREN